jgi:hypothetical protein
MLDNLIRWTYRNTFGFWQRLGFHVTPNHFYWPIPDTRRIRKEMWAKPSQMPGVNMNEPKQVELLELFAAKYKSEYEQFPREKTTVPYQYYVNNSQYASVDGEILYCIMREFKPKKIIEIGCGNSTYLTSQAILKNAAENKDSASILTSIEPYPNPTLREGFPGLSRLIISEVQDIPLGEFQALNDGDVLFIDTSHVLSVGSDVEYLFLEVVPRLKKGVIVHVHDIFLPAQYPEKWVLKQYVFYTEQQLLQSFLAFNDSFEVLWGGSFMHMKHPEKLERAFSSYTRNTRLPGSFWMRKTK